MSKSNLNINPLIAFANQARQLDSSGLKRIISLLQDINQEKSQLKGPDLTYPNLGICSEILIPMMEEWFVCFFNDLFANYDGDYGTRKSDDSSELIKVAVRPPYDDDEEFQDQYVRIVPIIDGMDSNSGGIGELNTSKSDEPLDLNNGMAYLQTPVRIMIESKNRPETNIIAGICFYHLFAGSKILQKAFNLNHIYPPKLVSARKVQENNELFRAIITVNLWSSMAWSTSNEEVKVFRQLLIRVVAKVKENCPGSIINIIGRFSGPSTARIEKVINSLKLD